MRIASTSGTVVCCGSFYQNVQSVVPVVQFGSLQESCSMAIDVIVCFVAWIRCLRRRMWPAQRLLTTHGTTGRQGSWYIRSGDRCGRMCTASIRVDRFGDAFLQPLASSSDLVVVGIDFISSGTRVGSSLLPPRSGKETFFCLATTANTWWIMRVVDRTEIASNLVVLTNVQRVRQSDTHIYLSPPTRYTCLIRPTVLVVDSVRIHRIHDRLAYKRRQTALCVGCINQQIPRALEQRPRAQRPSNWLGDGQRIWCRCGRGTETDELKKCRMCCRTRWSKVEKNKSDKE